MDTYAQNSPAFPTPPTPPSDDSAALDSSFLLLPALEIEFRGSVPAPVRVGDVLRLVIRDPALSALGDDAKLELPPGNSPLIEQGWHVGAKVESAPEGLFFEAVPLAGGRQTLPALMVIGQDGRPVAWTNPLVVEVQALQQPSAAPGAEKPEEPPEVLPPVEMSFPVWLAVITALLALAVLTGLGFGVARWIRARKKPAFAPVPTAPPRPAADVALEALAALLAKKLWTKGELKKHYFTVSDTMKLYLGERYGFDAVESTTSELIDALEKNCDDQIVDRVESLFERLDRVKFSDHVPHDSEPVEVVEAARKLVSETKPRPQAEPLVPDAGQGSSPAGGR